MSDKELKDLIEQLADKIQLEYPDLSSIEGLLNAIYARMGMLDSDNDNQLLSEILTAIKVLGVCILLTATRFKKTLEITKQAGDRSKIYIRSLRNGF